MAYPTASDLLAAVVRSGALREQQAKLRGLPDSHVILICDCGGRTGGMVSGMFDREAYGRRAEGENLWVCAVRWSIWKEMDFCGGLEDFGTTVGRDRLAIVTRRERVFTGTMPKDGEGDARIVGACDEGYRVSEVWMKYLDGHPGKPN